MVAAAGQRILRVERMGRVHYGPMLELQQRRHAQVVAGAADDTLFLLEHYPVITLGRNSGDGHVLASRNRLAKEGVEVFETGRGGDVTYHGPGQVVGYPIVRLEDHERDVRHFVARLEEIMIRTAADFGVEAQRVERMRGVWAGNAKIGAVGVRIAQWTTMHGFALNVESGIRGFDLIVPCGIQGRAVASLADLSDQPVGMAAVEDRLQAHAGAVFDRPVVMGDPTPLPDIRTPAEIAEVSP